MKSMVLNNLEDVAEAIVYTINRQENIRKGTLLIGVGTIMSIIGTVGMLNMLKQDIDILKEENEALKKEVESLKGDCSQEDYCNL